eukprot:scaffold4805_cov136-Cylindrotheca_fusiformis.AAC.1
MTSHQQNNDDIFAPVEKDGKSLTPVSNQKFALTAMVGVPIWLTVVLPLSTVYQVSKAIVKAVSPAPPPKKLEDSGYQVKDSDIIPRPKRTYDIVVLGATGFTGKLAARHLAKTYGCKDDSKVKWAIAGRSKDKLEAVKKSLANELQLPELKNIPTLVVDTSVPATLPNLVRDTRAVVTTVGPFQKYGSAVVEFCAKFGTHYCDTTGEASWVELMMHQWQGTAQQTGAKIVPFCGHDSIPWDLSTSQLVAELQRVDNEEDLASVEFVDELKSAPSGGTLETMQLSLRGEKLPPIEGGGKPLRNTAKGDRHINEFSNDTGFGLPKLDMPSAPRRSAHGSFFLMSMINSKVVGWTQALRQGAPLSYQEVAFNPDRKTAFCKTFGTVFLVTSLLNPLTAKLMTFVLPAPGQGPSMKAMIEDSYGAIYAKGTGTKGSKVESLMYFNKCPGYLETARMLVESGLSLALSEDSLPSSGGGFFSPAYGLGKVLLDRMVETGTHFSVRHVGEQGSNKKES